MMMRRSKPQAAGLNAQTIAARQKKNMTKCSNLWILADRFRKTATATAAIKYS
jgi:hypothetical protein